MQKYRSILYDNANLLILFIQDSTNLKYVYNDYETHVMYKIVPIWNMCTTIMKHMSEDFYELCRSCWKQMNS